MLFFPAEIHLKIIYIHLFSDDYDKLDDIIGHILENNETAFVKDKMDPLLVTSIPRKTEIYALSSQINIMIYKTFFFKKMTMI